MNLNLIAIDIGNTNITLALFLKGEEQSITKVQTSAKQELTDWLKSSWAQIPISKSSKQKKRNGVIAVSSVNPPVTEQLEQIVKDELDEKILLVGRELPLPMTVAVKESEKVGTDRIIAAAAAYDVAGGAVVVADVGTAMTIDLVDDKGVFLGGVICPGFEISAKALNENTAQLPKILKVTRPELPYGTSTAEAINCGLYYSAIGTLEEVIRRYAEKIGTWPQTVVTGSGARIIKDDCEFIDSFVTDLVVKGIALAYRKFIEEKA